MSRFLEALQSGRVLLMDGAMGTELQRANLQPGECGELWNLTEPERVRAIHQAYVDAGARCLLTNTFQANPLALARYDLDDQLAVMCQAAVDLAREAAGPDRWVFADEHVSGEPNGSGQAWEIRILGGHQPLGPAIGPFGRRTEAFCPGGHWSNRG